MKRKTVTALMAALCVGSSMTAYAAPETMPDGTVFDAEYYAQAYPDVVAELGTDKDAMYNHYMTFGRNEGRLAFEGDVNIPSQVTDELEITGIQGVFGAEYELPTYGYFEAYRDTAEPDQMITMNLFTVDVDEYDFAYDMERLAPYTADGYEWRSIHYVCGGVYNDIGRWWPDWYYRYQVENSSNWEWIDDDSISIKQFTITQDGVDYPECKYADLSSQWGEVHVLSDVYFLVPKGYTGNILFTIKASKPADDGGTTADDSNAVTYIF